MAAKYDGSAKRSPGRPRIAEDIRKQILEMAVDNPRWGYTRIQGALLNLGFADEGSNHAVILKDRGPAVQTDS